MLLQARQQRAGLRCLTDVDGDEVRRRGQRRQAQAARQLLILPSSLGHGGDRAPDVRRMRQRGQRADLGDAIDADLTSTRPEVCCGQHRELETGKGRAGVGVVDEARVNCSLILFRRIGPVNSRSVLPSFS
jgi:hypothetical protein